MKTKKIRKKTKEKSSLKSTTPIVLLRTNQNVNSKTMKEGRGEQNRVIMGPKYGPDHLRQGISLKISKHVGLPF